MKRLLALILALSLFLPVLSFAADEDEDLEIETLYGDGDETEDEDGEDEDLEAEFDFSDLDDETLAELDEDIDVGSIDLTELELNPNLPSHIINILLIGVDSHKPIEKDANGQVTRKNIVGLADSQIIVSIDTSTGVIKMISIQRDSYVPIPGPVQQSQKINMSFEIGTRRAKKVVENPDNWDNLTPGGASLAMRTINHNFDMNIQYCVAINFSGLAGIIDALGGIDIDMTKVEAKGVNSYLAKAYKKPSKFTYDPTYDKKTRKSTRKKLEAIDGVQHCDGIQALTYARLRSLKGQNDFNRTNRQRHLLDLLMKKVLEDIDLDKLITLVDTCVQHAYTNINASTFMTLGMTLIQAGIIGKIHEEGALFEQMQIPSPGGFEYKTIDGHSVLYYDVPKYKEELHRFIYGEYIPANP